MLDKVSDIIFSSKETPTHKIAKANFNKNIQLHARVIDDIANQLLPESKFLVFGLGYDSVLWNSLCDNTYFVEHNKKYIELNRGHIPEGRICFHQYNDISVYRSFKLSDSQLATYSRPLAVEEQGPFDVILIDAPTGYLPHLPGRLLACYWALNYLSHSNSVIYIDDSKRKLERHCIDRYFQPFEKTYFPYRNGTCKVDLSRKESL